MRGSDHPSLWMTTAQSFILQAKDYYEDRGQTLEKTLILGKIKGRRRRRRKENMKWLDGLTDSVAVNLSKLQETVKERKACCAAVYGWQRAGHDLATEQGQQFGLAG